MGPVEPTEDPSAFEFALKVREQRSPSRLSLSSRDIRADSVFQRSESLVPERFGSPSRNPAGLLQRSNSDRLQWSTSPLPRPSSPTTRSRQVGARGQASPSFEIPARPHSPVPRSPRSLLPEVALPESSKLSPRPRSPVHSPGRHSYSHRFTPTKSLTGFQGSGRKRRRLWKNGGVLSLVLIFAWFAVDWWFLSHFHETAQGLFHKSAHLQAGYVKGPKPPAVMYERLLSLAAHVLAEGETKKEPEGLWEEPFQEGLTWSPCADHQTPGHTGPPEPQKSTGYIMISANGGLNQQRVAVCNAVAVARLLNATLVLPRFLFNSVWRDASQFGDIYEESFFINYLKDDVQIVADLPLELQSLDLEAIGSLVTDMEVPKEAKPSFYLLNILPQLLRTRVVHFLGFGNRLSFDPVPFDIQRLRCRCNFHALRFLPKLQETGDLIVQRMRDRRPQWGPLEDSIILDGNGLTTDSVKKENGTLSTPKYLALHMRFEVDMAAYSMCYFGGGVTEREELSAYRAIHFPTLTKFEQSGKLVIASRQRELGKCPLMPEEVVSMLVALGFKRGTRIYLAGSHVYGGQARMVALTNLFPNIVTKENLLTEAEIAPFVNHSSQLAALDYLGCVAADVFAMSDSGSQLSSLVAGHRIYYGGGQSPTIRPNKKRLTSIFEESATIEWNQFEERVRKTVQESKRISVRPVARSIYRHPRCKECMCQVKGSNLD